MSKQQKKTNNCSTMCTRFFMKCTSCNKSKAKMLLPWYMVIQMTSVKSCTLLSDIRLFREKMEFCQLRSFPRMEKYTKLYLTFWVLCWADFIYFILATDLWIFVKTGISESDVCIIIMILSGQYGTGWSPHLEFYNFTSWSFLRAIHCIKQKKGFKNDLSKTQPRSINMFK